MEEWEGGGYIVYEIMQMYGIGVCVCVVNEDDCYLLYLMLVKEDNFDVKQKYFLKEHRPNNVYNNRPYLMPRFDYK